MHKTNVELLAPAGDREAMKAAVAAGADAVYFGVGQFNARRRATNFTAEELPEVMQFLHNHNVRGYIAFNTLIFPSEMEVAQRLMQMVADSGVDAAIVQDLGLAALLRKSVPGLPLHASTQMSLASADAVRVAADMGMSRVVLARECTLQEIAAIHEKQPDVELEVFVHGALCVSCSGQCLASFAHGGRSANRGQCAQPCRQAYTLLRNGEVLPGNNKPYALSPRDLAAWQLLPKMLKAGVTSFKIEGRLKGLRYASAIVAFYREALDTACNGEDFAPGQQRLNELDQLYSRSFTSGWYEGRDNASVMDGTRSRNLGLRVGDVTGRQSGDYLIKLNKGMDLQAGDGLVFHRPGLVGDPPGARARFVRSARQGAVSVSLQNRAAAEEAEVGEGWEVWRSDDPRLNKRIDQSLKRIRPYHREALNFKVHAVAGAPLMMEASTAEGLTCQCASDSVLNAESERPLQRDMLQQQLGKLTDSPFELGQMTLLDEAGQLVDTAEVMVPRSMLNALRRNCVEQICSARSRQWSYTEQQVKVFPAAAAVSPGRWQIIDDPATVKTLQEGDAEGVFLSSAACSDGAEYLRSIGIKVGWMPPQMLFEDDKQLLSVLESIKPEVCLVNNLGTLHALQPFDLLLVGGYGLNICNEAAAVSVMEMGLAGLVPSFELDSAALRSLVAAQPNIPWMLPVSGRMPLFHTVMCPLAADGSSGRCKSCAAPCRSAAYSLRDRIGEELPMQRDAEGRWTVYAEKSLPQRDLLPLADDLGIERLLFLGL